jgi:hypothetical protein
MFQKVSKVDSAVNFEASVPYRKISNNLSYTSSSPGRGKNCLFFMSSRQVLGPTQPPIQWVPGALSSEVKRPEREADHSPSTSVEVKKTWMYTYTYTPPYATSTF